MHRLYPVKLAYDTQSQADATNMVKTALISGVTGQDGAYLSHYLLTLGYRVVGTSRDAYACDTSRLARLSILKDVELVSLAPNDFRSVLKVISGVQPDELYNLAGQTSVGLSFEQPVECMESISIATLNFLEVIRFLGSGIRLFCAGSSECFGDIGNIPATEETPFHPRSPYAVAKASAFWQVATYREAYKMHACTGILANHESPLRPERFVTQKIIHAVREIRAGRQTALQLGNLEIYRDWGWAPDYVQAMHLMLQTHQPRDYIIASGTTTSLKQFVREAFLLAGLNMTEHLVANDAFLRPSDLTYSAMNPGLIGEHLGWSSSMPLNQIVRKMYDQEYF